MTTDEDYWDQDEDEWGVDVNGPNGVRVMAEQCSTCIFRPGNPMNLQAGRVSGMVREAERNDSFIICHQTLDGEAHEGAMCKGYLDTGRVPQLLRIAERLGMVEEVTLP